MADLRLDEVEVSGFEVLVFSSGGSEGVLEADMVFLLLLEVFLLLGSAAIGSSDSRLDLARRERRTRFADDSEATSWSCGSERLSTAEAFRFLDGGSILDECVCKGSWLRMDCSAVFLAEERVTLDDIRYL